jgi:GT2 family glycosyltransferase
MTASGFGFPIFQREIEKLTYVELITGYSMNFRRKFIENDLFDEFFTGYSFREDVELSYRISRKTKLVLIPEARFQHNSSPTNRINLEALKKMQFRNYYYVFRKHKYVSWVSLILFGYSVSGILVMDFVEWLFGFKRQKWEFLAADLSAVMQLAKGEL